MHELGALCCLDHREVEAVVRGRHCPRTVHM